MKPDHDTNHPDNAPILRMRSFRGMIEIRITHSHQDLAQALLETQKALNDLIANHLDPVPTYRSN